MVEPIHNAVINGIAFFMISNISCTEFQ